MSSVHTFGGFRAGFFDSKNNTNDQRPPTNITAVAHSPLLQTASCTTQKNITSLYTPQNVSASSTPTFKIESEIDEHKIKEVLLNNSIQALKKIENYSSPKVWMFLAKRMPHHSLESNENFVITLKNPTTHAEERFNQESAALTGIHLWIKGGRQFEEENQALPSNPKACPRTLVAEMWIILGKLNCEIGLGDEKFDPTQCFTQAVNADPHLFVAWKNLRNSLAVNHSSVVLADGKKINALNAALRCVQFPKEAEDPDCWYALSDILLENPLLEDKTRKTIHTPLQYCLEGLKKEKSLSNFGRIRLSRCLQQSGTTAELNGKEMGPVEVLLTLLDHQKLTLKVPFDTHDAKIQESSYWNALAMCLTKNSQQKLPPKLNVLFCLKRHLELAIGTPDEKIAWSNIAIYLTRTYENESKAKINFAGQDYGVTECFVKVLEMGLNDPNFKSCWVGLVQALLNQGKDSVLILGKPYTLLECAVKGVQLSWENKEAHESLLMVLDHLKINSVSIPLPKVTIFYTRTIAQITIARITIDQIMTQNKTSSYMYISKDHPKGNEEREHLFNDTLLAIGSEIKTSQEEILATELAEELEREAQGDEQTEKNKQTEENRRKEAAEKEEAYWRKSEALRLQEEMAQRSSAQHKNKPKADSAAIAGAVTGTDRGKRQFLKRSAQRKEKNYFNHKPFEVMERVDRWRNPRLTIEAVKSFKDLSKTDRIAKSYKDYSDEQIVKEVIKHYLPKRLEELVGNPDFLEDFAQYEGNGTYVIRMLSRVTALRIILGVSNGRIYHAGTVREYSQELPEQFSDDMLELPGCTLPEICGVPEPFSCYLLPKDRSATA